MIQYKGYEYEFEKGEFSAFLGEYTNDMFMLYENDGFIDSFDTEKELIEWVDSIV